MLGKLYPLLGLRTQAGFVISHPRRWHHRQGPNKAGHKPQLCFFLAVCTSSPEHTDLYVLSGPQVNDVDIFLPAPSWASWDTPSAPEILAIIHHRLNKALLFFWKIILLGRVVKETYILIILMGQSHHTNLLLI